MNRKLKLPLRVTTIMCCLIAPLLILPTPGRLARADTIYQPLPFSQDWTDISLITADDDWSGVPGVTGYRGDGLVTAIGIDPQTIITGTATPVDVLADRTNPDTLDTGGVAEFEIADPSVALQGSGTADAPHIALYLNTVGWENVIVQYTLRDLDGSTDDAIQRVALQYRVGESGNFTNVPAGFVADATTGPSLATLTTTVSATLPADANQQPQLQVRIITANAFGDDEWVGADDIQVTGTSAPIIPAANLVVSKSAPVVIPPGSPITYTINVSNTGTLDATDTTITDTLPTGFSYVSDTSGFIPTINGQNVVWSVGIISISTALNFTMIASPSVSAGVFTNTITATTTETETVTADNSASATTTVQAPLRIHDVQGATHLSPYSGTLVYGLPGVVTAVRSNGFYMQDPAPDANPATSEGIFVFTGSAPGVAVSNSVVVSGTVVEFRPNTGTTRDNNLTITELSNPSLAISIASSGNPLPATTVIGTGGAQPPQTVIEDDAIGGNVENGSAFQPASDGIDFYESLEHMRVQVNNAVASGPTRQFIGGLPNREVWVLADNGANAFTRTVRGGIVISPNDFNPERILVSNVFQAVPDVNVGDQFTQPIVGVMDYSFNKYQIYATSPLVVASGGLVTEVTTPTLSSQLSVGAFNVENLDPTDPITKFNRLATIVVNNLRAPDVIAVEEIQDNDGASNTTVTDASLTWSTLITAIVNADGPQYSFHDIAPQDDRDGGEPGGNIRVGFLFRADRGLSFVDRPGGTATNTVTATLVSGNVQLNVSPGRIDPTNPFFEDSRKPLAGEFMFRGHRLFIIANHFNSKGGDQPLYGRFQPPVRTTEVQRTQQALAVNTFVSHVLSLDPNANVIALGDFNDFEFSDVMMTLRSGGVLVNLMDTLPKAERYTYVFEGNSQSLDHILVSPALFNVTSPEYDVVHVNSEFVDQSSDHEPHVARFTMQWVQWLPLIAKQ